MERSSYGVIHAVVTCETCGWETHSYKNAQAIAAIHARSKGHRVVGELGIGFIYDNTGSEKTNDR